MTTPAIRGWCPGALRPMPSGDGLVVRVRPPGGRLTAAQAEAVAQTAAAHGSGAVELTARANLQLRGVSMAGHAPLTTALRAAGLIDADPQAEARRNIVVTPFADALADRLAARLAQALADGPALPSKFGFAVDTGPRRMLAGTSADIRLERGAGGLILRADGCPLGRSVTPDAAAAQALALARWFIAAGGVSGGRGRMAALTGRGVVPPDAVAAPVPADPPPGPCLVPQGALVAPAFGQLTAEALSALAALGPLRMTPWRMLLVEGAATAPILPGLLGLGDPLLRVHACMGSDGCAQGLQPTRPLARRLAPDLPPGVTLHVSGCAKGCAHAGPADLTLTATGEGFDMIRGGAAQSRPVRHLGPAPIFEDLT